MHMGVEGRTPVMKCDHCEEVIEPGEQFARIYTGTLRRVHNPPFGKPEVDYSVREDDIDETYHPPCLACSLVQEVINEGFFIEEEEETPAPRPTLGSGALCGL